MYLARTRTGVINDMVFIIFTSLRRHGRGGQSDLLPVGKKISPSIPRRVNALHSLLVDQPLSLRMVVAEKRVDRRVTA
jgi:hypothetical protein